VYKRSSGGTETEITSTYVASVMRDTNSSGYQSATWDCPSVSWSSSDALVVRVYTQIEGNPWTLLAEFITEQIDADSLDSSTWTVTYWTEREFDGYDIIYSRFTHGDSNHNCRIEGIVFKKAL